MFACQKCAALREVYWQRVAECGKIQTELRAEPARREELTAALALADAERVASRDALQDHQMKCVSRR
jgi:hypothetical protein